MANSKKPRKKFDGVRKASDRLCKATLMISVFGLGSEGTVWIKNNRPVPKGKSNPQEYALTFAVPRPWSFFCGVLCRDKLGKLTCEGEFLTLSRPMALHDEAVDEEIDSTIKRLVAQHEHDALLSPFLIASPEEQELSDESIYKLLKWLRVEEECKTPFEIVQLRNQGYEELRTVDFANFLPKQTACILRQNGVRDFADMRDVGLSHIQRFKGIGAKRVQQLIDGYHALLNAPEWMPKLTQITAFEHAFHTFREGIGRFLPEENANAHLHH